VAALLEEGTILLLDDRKARLAARLLRIQTLSVPAVLLSALRDGNLSYADFESDLYRLADFGYHISPRLFNDFLRIAKELSRKPSLGTPGQLDPAETA